MKSAGPDPLPEHVAHLVADDGGDPDAEDQRHQRQVEALRSKLEGAEARNPAVNSSASPGRKNPMSRPDSAKTIAQMPEQAEGVDEVFGVEEVRAAGRAPVEGTDGRARAGQISRSVDRLVPLRPADAGAAVGGLEAAQRPGEPSVAGAVGRLVDQVHRAEVARLHGQLERTAA